MKLEVIKIEDLNKALGFKEKALCQASTLTKPYELLKMEDDDSLVLRYIYRNFKPKRHLEFGTWLGFGTVICLEESDATVWTLNLSLGEFSDDGAKKNAYHIAPDWELEFRSWVNGMGLDFKADDSLPPSDSLAFCGMKYLKKKLGNRVCQIYCDSREWQTDAFPHGFFDTVLVDGDHSKSGVINDCTRYSVCNSLCGLVDWGNIS